MSGEITLQQSFYFAGFRRRSRAKVTLMKKRRAVLDYAGREAIMLIHKEIDRSSWKHPPENIKKSFSYKVGNRSVTITSTHRAAKLLRTYGPLDKGVKTHQMSPPRKKVPIMLDDGRLIFRDMTIRSLADGRWIHPGYHGKHFLRRGADKARARINEILADHAIAQVARIMGF